MTNQEAIFEKARELGELIKISPIKQKADETSENLLKDAEAKSLIDGYNRLREQKMNEFREKQPTPEEAKQANDYLQQEFEKIAANPTIKEYLEAASAYEMLLGQMDSILKHFIVGEQEGGCTGSCSTCGGCH